MREAGYRLHHFANPAAMTCGPCPGLLRLLRLAGFLFWCRPPMSRVLPLSLLLSAVLAAPAAHAAPTPITIANDSAGSTPNLSTANRLCAAGSTAC